MRFTVPLLLQSVCTILPCELGSNVFYQVQSYLESATSSINTPPSHNVAIIGAGAAGSSAAFWIAKGKERLGADINVDIYESQDYVGGRSTVVYPYGDTTYEPVELGASIFVKVNKNLMRASREFNLSLFDFEDENEVSGVWDGEKFVVNLGGSGLGSWWRKLQIIRRYGWNSPKRTVDLVQGMVDSFVELYTNNPPKWRNISEVSLQLDFTKFTVNTTSNYMEASEISRLWTHEVIEAATRVNYGQNADDITALGGTVSMAASGASSVKGGNFQIFENFVSRSGANLFLNTPVTSVKKLKSNPPEWQVSTASGESKIYNTVIIATPLTSSLELIPSYAEASPEQKYVHLYVTLLTTTASHPSGDYFGTRSPPKSVLTTWEGVRNGGIEPEFNSLAYHGSPIEPEGKAKEWVVKIFSKKPLTNRLLRKLFNNEVGWIYRKEWDAYPVLYPRKEYPPVVLDKGLYHVNSFEPFISTMETETIASRNIVDLIFEENFGFGICGLERTEDPSEDYVYGWDC
ncbi:hypothetical protein SISSUDRAFT_846389 [Sistotremastrum suecicum HHB10207 ss-3]|uniref:Prenylcysteine lyase domain-containing protein n=1 Tax=Sistotremastrum suecicum HHB10207 ss-3 TaxID=1314776 RepID=A0A166HJD3_9AGAM|nr:hypothetical protein SISSUDRAFT_846389 [Sistotremastrum suecicum HHB10207 ss-3]